GDGLGAVLAAEGERLEQRLLLAAGEAGLVDGRGREALFHRLDGGQLVERVLAGREFVGDAGQRIDVVAGMRLLALEHFRRGIGGRERTELRGIEYRGLAGGVRARGRGAGDAEVEDLHRAVAQIEAVARLEVGV